MEFLANLFGDWIYWLPGAMAFFGPIFWLCHKEDTYKPEEHNWYEENQNVPDGAKAHYHKINSKNNHSLI